MAAPYVLLSGFPELARRFPRTGPWSDAIKKEMGLAHARHRRLLRPTPAGPPHARRGRVVAAVRHGRPRRRLPARPSRPTVRRPRPPPGSPPASVAAMVAVALVLVLRLTRWPYEWSPYTPAALAQATAAGHPVVIDFTAAWCPNCHYLEATALHDPKLVAAVRDHHAVMLRADITNGTEPGQALLDQLNVAKSIPVTAVYPPPRRRPPRRRPDRPLLRRHPRRHPQPRRRRVRPRRRAAPADSPPTSQPVFFDARRPIRTRFGGGRKRWIVC